jgi:hypothetical protein
MFYTSKQWAVFRLSIGTFQAIQDGTAPSIDTTLPAVVSNTWLHGIHPTVEIMCQ